VINGWGPTPQLTTVKARYLLGLFLVAAVGVPIIWPGSTKIRLVDSTVTLGCYLLIAWVIQRHCSRNGVAISSILGEWPSPQDLRRFLLLGIPLVSIGAAGFYAVYLPVSWVWPALVTVLLKDVPELIIWSRAPAEIVSNTLNIGLMIVVAPIVEEIMFRGFLLNRWWEKYGREKAIILSSLIFGVMHLEFIGGIVFGLVLSRIYVKTRSLIGPIVIHMSNNAVVVLLVIAESMTTDGPAFTLHEFESYWWMAPLGLSIGLPWLIWFYRDYLRQPPSN
jgi:hypothetical protein